VVKIFSFFDRARPQWIGFVAAALFSIAAPVHAAAPVTFNKNIAPILWAHCASCHRPGEMAPFSLVEYSDVITRARQIAAVTANRTMPPWLPEPGFGTFVNQRRLNPEEIAAIQEWVKAGAPRGDAKDLPPRPTWTDGWQLGTPDLVVRIPEPFVIFPGSSDVFRNFAIPIPIATTRYVRGIEVRPGNAKVVHHASLAIDRTRASRTRDEADPLPGFSGGMFSDTARNPESRALGWTPGMTASFEPDGMPWRLEKGSDLVLELHMIAPRDGKPQSVQPSVGFYFSDMPPSRSPIDFKIGSKDIDIPAGRSDYAIEDRYTLPVDVDVLSVYPHAHYLAKEMKAEATLPDGRVVPLIWIRNWDFHWQDDYRYATPIHLPRGSVVTMRYTYDNSAANKHNPRQVPSHVVYGPQSSDEMGDLWLRLLPETASDADVLARSYRANELAKDIRLRERLVAEHPADAKWRNALGASYLEAGNLPASVTQLEEAARLAPDQAEAHNNLGEARRIGGDLTGAIAEFREAARLAPKNDVVQFNLANAFGDHGDLQEAIDHFKLGLALNPGVADAQNNLGVALASLGQIDEALAHIREALAIQPDYTDAQENLRMLTQLQKR
jgi:Flp pilus assembly protein TadD/mono/diheme cytochrome c family protein